MITLDDIRAKYPHLAVAVYALTPGGPVVLELLSADGSWSQKFTAPTEAAAVAQAFPDDEPVAPVEPTPPPAAPAVPVSNVFD
jgi:hypothetical protein